MGAQPEIHVLQRVVDLPSHFMAQPLEELKRLLRPSAGQTKMVEAKSERLH